MMPDMRRSLSADQIWAVVAFLESQGGEVTVSGSDIAAAAEEPGADDKGPAVGTPASGATPAGGGAHSATLDPRALLKEKGCIGCHQFEGQGAPIGPPVERMQGLTTDYLRRAILMPNADTAKGFEKFAGTMPPTFGQQLSAAQLEALVDFLRARK
jgi:mono/diheme cytochrome c family protein